MNSGLLYYKESGKINFTGLAISLMIILGVNSLLGYIYSFIIFYMPLIYVNFLISVGFGIILSIYTQFLFRITHNRSRQSKMILILISGISANLFQWVVYIDTAILGQMPQPGQYYGSLEMLFDPAFFFGIIGEINKYGMWELFGAPVKGLMLALIWILEFAIIAGVTMYFFLKSKPYPYSENLGHWYSKYTLSRDFEAISSHKMFIKKLDGQSMCDFITGLKSGIALRHMKIHVFYEKDEENQYLSFENRLSSTNGKVDREIIENCIRVDKPTVEKIMNAFPYKKEKNEIF